MTDEIKDKADAWAYDLKNHSAKTFDEYEEKDPLDQLEGGGDDVILGAYFANTAQAIAENDLLPPGNYPVHDMKGQYRVYVEKLTNKTHRVVFQVYNHVMQQHAKELQERKEIWADRPDDAEMRPIYDVPIWINIMLLVTRNVHPRIDEQAYEKVLAEEFPELWITPSMMPKRLIM